MLFAATSVPAAGLDPSIVIAWNKLAQATNPDPSPTGLRYYAIMHIAMFDAVNSISLQYTPFRTRLAVSSGGSMEAAAAQAAHDVLYALVAAPTNPADKVAAARAMFHDALTAQLENIPPGLAKQGQAVGAEVAARTLDWRAADGIPRPAAPPTYVLPAITGLRTETGSAAALTWLPTATSFTMKSNTQFMVARHPELNSARYATDFEEVKIKGDSNSNNLYEKQTAYLFAGVITTTNIFMMWNDVAADVAVGKHLTLVEAARLFAMLNAVMMDSLINTQTGKFTYGLWRPLTAIQNGANDANDTTSGDPGWLPILSTPPYLTYPGNMAGIGACAAKALALGIQVGEEVDDYAFTVTWKATPDNYERNYSSFS
jgi:hypothetical protein